MFLRNDGKHSPDTASHPRIFEYLPNFCCNCADPCHNHNKKAARAGVSRRERGLRTAWQTCRHFATLLRSTEGNVLQSVDEDYTVLRDDAVFSGSLLQTFRNSLLPPPPG